MMRTILFSALLLGGSALAALPVQAQQRGTTVEVRVGKLEGEMRAVQRKIFPGSNGQYIEPDNAPAPDNTSVPGSPSGSAVADLTARINALESQMSGLTGQIETTEHRVQVLEEGFAAYKGATDARLKALESGPSAITGTAVDGAASSDVGANAPAPIRPSTRPGTARPPAVKPTNTGTGTSPDPLRARKVAAIERPDSGDAAEDQYLYGYRLWEAKYYPEAEAQFTQVVTKYPTHKRASYAQNLLGRSYLEDGKPSLASLAFYDNYKKFPDGDRAPDSLFYLADALVKLGKPASQVCRVYTELSRTYATRIDTDAKMKAGIAKGRAASKCT